MKLYLLNREEALLGYYMPERPEEDENQALDMYASFLSPLFSFLQQEGRQNAEFVEQSQLWFDALCELTLS